MEQDMGLARYALVFGLGYAAGHPTGRKKLQAVPGQVKALAQRPEARQLRDKGKAAAEQAVQTAKGRLGSSGSGPDTATTSTEPAGGAAETATRSGWRPLGRRRGPVIAEETVVVTETPAGTTITDEVEAATLGTLPPSEPGTKSR
jgi:hypothetical protein